jgi:hypothetical protein
VTETLTNRCARVSKDQPLMLRRRLVAVRRWTAAAEWVEDARQIPATSRESDAFSTDLGRRGFSFVGSTVTDAHIQAVGMVNDDLARSSPHVLASSPSRPPSLAAIPLPYHSAFDELEQVAVDPVLLCCAHTVRGAL